METVTEIRFTRGHMLTCDWLIPTGIEIVFHLAAGIGYKWLDPIRTQYSDTPAKCPNMENPGGLTNSSVHNVCTA